MDKTKMYSVILGILIAMLVIVNAFGSAVVEKSENNLSTDNLHLNNNMQVNDQNIDPVSEHMSTSSEESDCGCDNSKATTYGGSDDDVVYAGLSSEDIAALKEQGEKEGWTFIIDENSTFERPPCCNFVNDEDIGGTPFDPEPVGSLPDEFDWRDEVGGLPSVGDQGLCGSCWAFATTGALECNIKIVDGDTVSISEQHLVSCNTNGYGCNGGSFCFKYYEWKEDACGEIGAVLGPDFPYTGSEDPCNCPHPRTYKIDDYGSVNESINAIKQAIMTYGPIAAYVYAGDLFGDPVTYFAWQLYGGGVFNHNGVGAINHAVVLVGWDDNQGSNGVWYLRNSWGTGWGENGGYMRIEYDCCNVGDYLAYMDYSGGMEKMELYGNQYEACFGDIQNYGAHSIRMSQSTNSGGWAAYVFDLGEDETINDDLHVGVYFCDWGWFGDGPSVYIYNWNTWSYDLLKSNLGDTDSLKWKWVGTFDSNRYVYGGNNEVWVKIYADADDDTILNTVAIKYTLVPKIPDLECYNVNLDWVDVTPGSTVTGSFKVKNIGDPSSELNWHVDYWPSWGTWTFNPSSGTNLKPEDGPVTVAVTVVAPDGYGQTYNGEVWVRNTDNWANDYCILPTSLSTAPDTTPPETYIDTGPSGTINYNDVTFTWHGSDDVTQPDNLVYSYILEGYTGSWSSWTSSTSKDYYDLPDGTYTFKVKAKDEAGNEDPSPATRIFTVDTPIPTPNLDCSGSLSWTDVIPGSTVTGNFLVSNIGDSGSELNWEITDWPSWGTWTFNPSSGTGLKPEDGSVTVQVTVVAPNQYGETFTGQVKIVNQEDSSDYCYISASLSTLPPNVPDLDCSGSLSWTDVIPGSTVTDTFTVKNIGDPSSELDWQITDWPSWGTWSLVPSNGQNLKPEDGPITVQVTVIAPNQQYQTFTGEVKVINTENSNDFELIDVILETTMDNDPPNVPTITGPTNGNTGQSYEYSFTATDPDGDDIYYYIDWGDGIEDGWLGSYTSGTTITKSHTWSSEGSYTIQAKAKDINDLESDWGTLEVTMPVNQPSSQPSSQLFQRALQHLPNAFPILRQLLGQ